MSRLERVARYENTVKQGRFPAVGRFRVIEVITEPSAVAPDARVNFGDIRGQMASRSKTMSGQLFGASLTLASGATALGSVMHMTFSSIVCRWS
ncbi:MAG: hypothetical protein AABN95_06895 [Acidobacteriota bacterium]